MRVILFDTFFITYPFFIIYQKYFSDRSVTKNSKRHMKKQEFPSEFICNFREIFK